MYGKAKFGFLLFRAFVYALDMCMIVCRSMHVYQLRTCQIWHLGVHANFKPRIAVLQTFSCSYYGAISLMAQDTNSAKEFLNKLKPIDYIWGCVFYQLSSVINSNVTNYC